MSQGEVFNLADTEAVSASIRNITCSEEQEPSIL